jgi:hypothetical protein
MRRLTFVACALVAATASAGDAPLTHGEMVSHQSGAWRVPLATQTVSVEVRSGGAPGVVGLANGTPFTVALQHAGGATARAAPLQSLALPCAAGATPQAWLLRIDEGPVAREQWITARCGEAVQLIAAEGLPASLQVAP